MDQIIIQAKTAITELLEQAHLEKGSLLVIGCSTSEVIGKRIGKASSLDAAKALAEGIVPVLKTQGIRLAVQCCEHLNRALIVEKETAAAFRYPPVNVMPTPDAGGAFAAHIYELMEEPVAVETIHAQAGMDIGDTLIGMHLQPVAVPVRLSISAIGSAHLTCARTRPKYIGGPRAVYKG